MSCRSDYRKVEIVEPAVTLEPTEVLTEEPIDEPTATPLVEIPLESTLPTEPVLTPIPTETPAEVPTPTTEALDQITTPSDLTTTLQDIV